MLRALSGQHHCEEMLHEEAGCGSGCGKPSGKMRGTTNFHPASEVLSPSGVDFSHGDDAVSAQPPGKLSGFEICRWREGFVFCWAGLAVSEIAQNLQHGASKLLPSQGTSRPGACMTEILQPPGSWELPFLSRNCIMVGMRWEG